MQERWSRSVPCRDHSDRAKYLLIFLTENNDVGMHAPAGEVAVVYPTDVEAIKAALTAAHVEAIHRRGGAR